MSSDLKYLIDYYTRSIKYLEQKLEDCIKNRDFQEAQSFASAISYTSSKLSILKSVDNPKSRDVYNYKFLSTSLEGMLASFEERLKASESLAALESMQRRRDQMKVQIREYKEKALRYSRTNNYHLDDDTILGLLHQLMNKELEVLHLELTVDEIILQIKQVGEHVECSLFSDKYDFQSNPEQYKFNLLSDVGFNVNTLKVLLSNDSEIDRIKILEIISFITYEVFTVRGDSILYIRIQ